MSFKILVVWLLNQMGSDPEKCQPMHKHAEKERHTWWLFIQMHPVIRGRVTITDALTQECNVQASQPQVGNDPPNVGQVFLTPGRNCSTGKASSLAATCLNLWVAQSWLLGPSEDPPISSMIRVGALKWILHVWGHTAHLQTQVDHCGAQNLPGTVLSAQSPSFYCTTV